MRVLQRRVVYGKGRARHADTHQDEQEKRCYLKFGSVSHEMSCAPTTVPGEVPLF